MSRLRFFLGGAAGLSQGAITRDFYDWILFCSLAAGEQGQSAAEPQTKSDDECSGLLHNLCQTKGFSSMVFQLINLRRKRFAGDSDT
jgi:hypothetical protein